MTRWLATVAFAPRTWRALALSTALTASLAIVSTYHVFSQTFDEPAHIGAGMEWLSRGTYTFEAQHPPLGRVASAVGPYLAGERLVGSSMWFEGARILGSGDHYVRTLALARLGQLPFFLLLCLVVWTWGRRLAGEAAGALAVVFAATNPNILAHAALATTDIAPTALVPAALLGFAAWLERPALGRGALFGVALGAALVSKFSALAFIAPTVVVGYGAWASLGRKAGANVERVTPGARDIAIVAVTAWLVIWTSYRFEVGPLVEGGRVSVLAPTFFRGLVDFATHGALGHTAFLLGHVSSRGWWYYFLVVLAVKTPLPLLALGIVGAWAGVRAARRDGAWEAVLPLIGACVVLAVGMATHVDIGVRHILAIYPLLAVLAGVGSMALWQRSRSSGMTWVRTASAPAAVAIVASTVLVAVRAHPDHLAYFNPVAASHPERVLSDSNLDWGQDLYRLADEMRRRGIDSIALAYFGSANPAAAGVRGARPLAHNERVTGWIAVSETYLAGAWSDTGYVWLRDVAPVSRIGRSMRLYFLDSRQLSALR